MSVISNNQLAGASGQGGSGYEISKSLRFNSGDSSYLSRTPSSAGNQKTWTWSGWVKRSGVGTNDPIFDVAGSSTKATQFALKFHSNDYISIDYGGAFYLQTTRLFRDPSAWMHLVVVVNTTLSTADNRVRLYVNGIEETVFTTRNNPNQNENLAVNRAAAHTISTSSSGLDGYLADVYFIDGQALAPTDFGEFDDNNVWQPKEFTGNYGTHVAPTYDSSYGSDITSTEVAKTIDGDLSTYGVPTGDFVGYTYSASNEPFINIKWENTKSSSITVYIQPWVSGSAANSGTFDSSGGNSVTIAAGATLNTKFNFPSGYDGYFRVYTSGDGVYLRMYDTGGTRAFSSFHLDFNDNSSDSALGTDAAGSNNWTVHNLSSVSTTPAAKSSISYAIAPTDYPGTSTNNQSSLSFGNTWNVGSSLTTSSYIIIDTGAKGHAVDLTPSSSDAANSYSDDLINWTSGASSTANSNYTEGRYYWIQSAPSGYGGGLTLTSASTADGDSMIDTPMNLEADSGNNPGNYATLNPLISPASTYLSDGNLKFSATANSWVQATSTIGMNSGKWYWEVLYEGTNTLIGVTSNPNSGSYIGSGTGSYGRDAGGGYYNEGSSGSGFTSFASGSTIGVALDMDNGTVTLYVNGVAESAFATGLDTSKTFYAGVSVYGSTSKNTINFGQRQFVNTIPAGFKSLCTTNLPDPTIADGSTVFDVLTWNGNDTQRNITGLGFSPDLVWIKQRSGTALHSLQDTVRGATKNLVPNDTQGEGTETAFLNAFLSNGFSIGTSSTVNDGSSTYVGWAWDAGSVTNPVGDIWSPGASKYIGIKFATASGGTVVYGQTSGSDTVEVWTSSDNSSWTQQGSSQTLSTERTLTTSDQYVYIRNTSNATFSNWYAAASNGADGHYSSTTYPSGASWSGPGYTDHDFRDVGGVTNTNGSILSIVRANASAGFSIVKFTNGNGTVGHGLNSPPELIITKDIYNTYTWSVYSKPTTKDAYLAFNSSQASGAVNGMWGSAEPTSSVFGTTFYVASVGNELIAYCFSSVEGYSRVGSYTGNGDADGPFVYTGHRSRFLLIKRSDGTANWQIYDTARDPYNAMDSRIKANANDAEASQSGYNLDILSNGFKPTGGSNDNYNYPGATYVYASFAEHPFKTSRAR